MNRMIPILLLTTFAAACGDTPLGSEATFAPSTLSMPAVSALNGVSCSDEAPVWLTGNLSVEHRRAVVLPFQANAGVLEADVHYSRSGDGAWSHVSSDAAFDNTGEYRLVDSQGGGRYTVRLRSRDCDGQGAWSRSLTVYFTDNVPDSEPVFPEEPQYCPYED